MRGFMARPHIGWLSYGALGLIFELVYDVVESVLRKGEAEGTGSLGLEEGFVSYALACLAYRLSPNALSSASLASDLFSSPVAV